MSIYGIIRIAAAVAALACLPPAIAPVEGGAPESPRMSRAKDLIADEQWIRAIEELRAAVRDPKEPAKDEALFWLAHSQNQVGDRAAAVETILQLEADYPKSRWTKPASSLRLEIAQRLRRNDVLWLTAVPPAPPAPVPQPVPPRTPRATRLPPPAVPPAPPARAPLPPEAAPAAPLPPEPWFGPEFHYDTDLRIQALGSLIKTDAAKVIPILKQIALDADNTGEARRALFVLAQSGRPEARTTVVEVAQTAAEPVRIAAVRELGRFGGADVGRELLQVYSTANEEVKRQVVMSLGERSETVMLLRIAQSEANRALRERAIVTLGRAGGRDELRQLYRKAARASKRAIIVGLFNAGAEAELRQIADQEKDPVLRREALTRLRRLETPRPAKRDPRTP